MLMIGGGLLAAAIKLKAHKIVICVLVAALIAVVAVTPDGHHVTESLTVFARTLGGQQ